MDPRRRFIVFSSPPTTQQLRSTSFSPQDCPPWTWRPLFPSSPDHLPFPRPSSTPGSTPIRTTHSDHDPQAHQLLEPTDLTKPSNLDVDQHHRQFQRILTSFESPRQTAESNQPTKKDTRADLTEITHQSDSDSLSVPNDHLAGVDSLSIDYYQSQLDYRDSLADESAQGTTMLLTAAERTSCLLSISQPAPQAVSPSSPQLDPHFRGRLDTQADDLTFSESVVSNLPEWHFDSRSCVPLDQLTISHNKFYNILFHLTQKFPLTTIELKKARKNGLSSAKLAHFECLDDSGSTLKLTLWDEAAEELEQACFVGDIIYLSAIAMSSYQGNVQGSTTKGTRAQICYRLRPTHHTHLQLFCPDLRLAYDPTTRRVNELVQWAKCMFD